MNGPNVQMIRNVKYGEVAGRPLYLDIAQPQPRAEFGDAPRPAVLELHGGAWMKGDKDLIQNLSLAKAGFFTVSVAYRLSHEATFPAQIHDVKAAVRWLRAHADELHVDSERIGVWGVSAGGHLAALLGTSAHVADLEGKNGSPGYSSAVQAVVAICPPVDVLDTRWREAQQSGAPPSLLLGDVPQAKRNLARLANPVTHMSKGAPPFLIMHGDADETVPFEQSVYLRDALEKVNADVTFIPLPGGGHGLEAFSDEIDARRLAFFQHHLGANGAAH